MNAGSRFSRAALLGGGTAVAMAGAMPLRASAADLIPLRVGVPPTESTAEAYYGIDKGFYKAAGFDVTVTPMFNGGAMTAALAGGSLDIITTTVLPISEAYGHGLDVRVFAPGLFYEKGQSISLVVAVALASPAKTAPDLNGKTIAINGLGDLTQLSLLSWLGSNGADVKSVKMLEVPFPEMGAALDQGRVDAALLVEPFTSALKAKTRVLGDALSGMGSRFVGTIWAAKLSWLNQNRDVATRFAATTLKIGSWANTHNDESAPIAAQYTHMPVATINNMARAVFATTPITGALIQPVLDAQAKYFGTARVAGNDLIWPARA